MTFRNVLFMTGLIGAAIAFHSVPAEAITISGVSIPNTPITFEQGGLPNGTTITYQVDTPANISIQVSAVQNFGDTGIPVAVLTQSYTTPNTPKTIFWNGLWLINGELGRINSNFQFKIIASSNGATNENDPSTLVNLNSIDIHNVAASPTLDANGQPSLPYLIAYSLAKEAKVTATITDSSGTVVRTLVDNQLQFGEVVSSHTLAWNGLDKNGKALSLGLYTLHLNATDPSNGGTALERTRTITLTTLAGAAEDPKKLFEDNVFVYPNPIRDAQGIFQFRAIREGADISLRIYTITGDLVLDKDIGSVAVGNVQTFTWDASNGAGRKVGRGLYYYVMREKDDAGVLQVTKKLAVIR